MKQETKLSIICCISLSCMIFLSLMAEAGPAVQISQEDSNSDLMESIVIYDGGEEIIISAEELAEHYDFARRMNMAYEEMGRIAYIIPEEGSGLLPEPVTEKSQRANKPVRVEKPFGEDRSICIDLSELVLPNGQIVLTNANWQPGMQDPQGNNAIVICGYEYHNIVQINLSNSNMYVYCNDGAKIFGQGINDGFQGRGYRHNLTVRNCYLSNYEYGIRLMGRGCEIYDNEIENAYVGISGCDRNSSIYNNKISNLIYAGWGIHVSGNIDYYEYIENNTLENLKVGIYADNIHLVANNTIRNATQAGTTFRFSGLLADNSITNSGYGIEIRADNTYPRQITVRDNKIVDSNTGIYVYYANTNPSAPFNPDLKYTIRDNTVEGVGVQMYPTERYGIIVDGRNYGFNYSTSRIENNRFTDQENGMKVWKKANSINVKDNLFIRSDTGINCNNSNDIQWSCNECRRATVLNDNCMPEAFCEICGGGSPIFMKQIMHVMAYPK